MCQAKELPTIIFEIKICHQVKSHPQSIETGIKIRYFRQAWPQIATEKIEGKAIPTTRANF